MSQEKFECLLNKIFGTITGLAGAGSFADNAEQALRIFLLIVSITSGIILIVINWDKFKARIKRALK